MRLGEGTRGSFGVHDAVSSPVVGMGGHRQPRRVVTHGYVSSSTALDVREMTRQWAAARAARK